MRIIGPLIGVMLVAVAAFYAIAVVAAALAIYGIYLGCRALWRGHRAHIAAAEHERLELLARCDIQNQWYLAGDSRGTYGRHTQAA